MDEQDKELAQRDAASSEPAEWAIPTGAPEEFGFPAKSTLPQRQCWQNQERFLAAFRQCCRIGEAAEAVGLTYWAVRRWVDADLYSFKKRFENAVGAFLEKLEAEAYRRGVEGIDHPVIHKGVITNTYKQYSDNLLMFRMKKLDPNYRDNPRIPTGEPQVQITRVTVVLDRGPDAEGQSRLVEETSYRVLSPPGCSVFVFSRRNWLWALRTVDGLKPWAITSALDSPRASRDRISSIMPFFVMASSTFKISLLARWGHNRQPTKAGRPRFVV